MTNRKLFQELNTTPEKLLSELKQLTSTANEVIKNLTETKDSAFCSAVFTKLFPKSRIGYKNKDSFNCITFELKTLQDIVNDETGNRDDTFKKRLLDTKSQVQQMVDALSSNKIELEEKPKAVEEKPLAQPSLPKIRTKNDNNKNLLFKEADANKAQVKYTPSARVPKDMSQLHTQTASGALDQVSVAYPKRVFCYVSPVLGPKLNTKDKESSVPSLIL
jgi:hypothetical protein